MTFGIKSQALLSEAVTLTPAEILQFGNVLVIAPHQDDESLACGGIIAGMKSLGLSVHVLFVSDGSMSHPGSKQFSDAERTSVRNREAINALTGLGVPEEDIIFMEFKDGSVPNLDSPNFSDAVWSLQLVLKTLGPSTIFVPYRVDPHKDHQATWQLLNKAADSLDPKPRIFEYPVWLWVLGREDDYPDSLTTSFRKADIHDELPRKRKAIAAHRSQLGDVFLDDPSGFVLTPDLLAHFDHPFEIFFESKS